MSKTPEKKTARMLDCAVCGKNPMLVTAERYICWRCTMGVPEGLTNQQLLAEVPKPEVTHCESEPAAPVVTSDKPSTCPSCGGAPKGRGYSHTEECPESAVNKLKTQTKEPSSTCPSCGGVARGRGYMHTAACPENKANKTVATNSGPVATCPSCGGTAKGRGYSHTEECPESTANKLKAKRGNTPVEVCPSCGGPRRGRGYSHTIDCKGTNNG